MGVTIIALKGKPNSDKSGITFQFAANTAAAADAAALALATTT